MNKWLIALFLTAIVFFYLGWFLAPKASVSSALWLDGCHYCYNLDREIYRQKEQEGSGHELSDKKEEK